MTGAPGQHDRPVGHGPADPPTRLPPPSDPAGRTSQLLSPEAIAILGASGQTGHPSGRIAANLAAIGFPGRVVSVARGPDRQSALDPRALRQLAEVANRYITTGVVCVRAADVPVVLAEAADAGVRNFVILSSGFYESGPDGLVLHGKLSDVVAHKDLLISGPNSMGHLDLARRTCTSFTTVLDSGIPRQGMTSIISQSGGLGAAIWSMAAREGLGLHRLVSVGNGAQLDLTDYCDAIIDESPAESLCICLEDVRDGARLIGRCAQWHLSGRNVVVLAIGRREAGARAAASHTGAIISQPGLAAELLTGAGAVVTSDPNETVAVLKLLEQQAARHSAAPVMDATPRQDGEPTRDPGRTAIAIVTNTGGTAVLGADLAQDAGLQLAVLRPGTRQRLRAVLPAFASVQNPVDLTGQVAGQESLVSEVIGLISADDGVGGIIGMGVLPVENSRRFAVALAKALATVDQAALIAWFGADSETKRQVQQYGVPFFDDARLGLRALAAILPGWPVASQPADRGNATGLPASGSQPGRTVTEADIKREIAAAGFPVPASMLCATEDECLRAAAEVGYPVALKVISTAIPHKAASGALALQITAPRQLRHEYRRLTASWPASTASLDGYLVERMISIRHELMLGFAAHESFGPVCLLGEGGAAAESTRSRVIGPAPADMASALELCQVLARRWDAMTPELAEAVAPLLMRLHAWWGERKPALSEVEFNPIAVAGDGGLMVLDALGTEAAFAVRAAPAGNSQTGRG